MSNDLLIKSLIDLVKISFENLGFITLHPMQVSKHPMADARLSYVLKQVGTNMEYIGVIVCDWKRIVGVGQINKAKEVLQTCPELSGVLIVSSMGFSKSAIRSAEEKEINLISRRELISLTLKQLEIL